MKHQRLNAYHIMWLFVFFDLPTNSKKERKAANRFRKNLLQDGFVMMQYSVYIRHCPSLQNAETHIRRVNGFMPDKGFVSILTITDKQFGKIINIWGANSNSKNMPDKPMQLEIF